MKASILDINGNKIKEINLPVCFASKIREDIVSKVLETKKKQQPYGPSPVAGKQVSARGKIRHRRHIWQTSYGRGMSRTPRKVMSRRGSQFNWEGAGVPQTKGGMRAHPPKVISMINTKRINKKELKIALNSSISATASENFVRKKYGNLKGEEIKHLPFIVESKITSLKSKELLNTLKKVVGNKIFEIGISKKRKRSGKGKARGRSYKKGAGILLVLGEKDKMKSKLVEVAKVKNIGINDLARGGLGRLTIYSEGAINDLNKLKENIK